MASEKIEGRKRGLALLKKLGEATADDPLKSMIGGWHTDKKKDLAWYSVERYDPEESIGKLLGLFASMLDDVDSNYSLDGQHFADDRTLIRCAIFFDADEMLADPELAEDALRLGLTDEGSAP